MRNVINKKQLLLIGASMFFQSGVTYAAYEKEASNACPQRWELVLSSGVPKIKRANGSLYQSFPIDKIGSTTNIWSIRNYFSGGLRFSRATHGEPQVEPKTFSFSNLPEFIGHPVPNTNKYMIWLANEDRKVRTDLFLTSAEKIKWKDAMAARAADMKAAMLHLERAKVTKTINPAELYDLLFDEITVASECIRYRNMVTDTAGYIAPASNPNYKYGWLPAVL